MNLEEKYFSTEGRLNRKPFIHYIIFLIVISLAFIWIITLLGLASALSIAILGENVNDLNVLLLLQHSYLMCFLYMFHKYEYHVHIKLHYDCLHS